MSTAVAFIDWISYTRMNDVKKLEYPSTFSGAAREVIWEWQRFNAGSEVDTREPLHVRPNRPFANARICDRTKSRIEWGGGSDRILCSFSGEGCRFLRSMERTQELLASVCGDVSRIDLSIDIFTELSPFDFAAKRDKIKHKNGAMMFSEEGQTQYVGSWSSDRFARIYRYNPPHEREDFLRVEHVFKGKQAKILASRLVAVLPKNIIGVVGEVYGWSHEEWFTAISSAETPEQVVWYKEEKHVSKTVKWLNETCAPALIRMVREGEVANAQEWFNHLVLEPLYNTGIDRAPSAPNTEG